MERNGIGSMKLTRVMGLIGMLPCSPPHYLFHGGRVVLEEDGQVPPTIQQALQVAPLNEPASTLLYFQGYENS